MEPARLTRRSIERILLDLERESERAGARLEETTRRIAEEKAERARLVRRLAELRLAALERDGVTAALDAGERAAAEALTRFRESAEAAAAAHRRWLERVEALVKERDERAASLEAAVDAVEDFEEAQAALLESDPALAAAEADARDKAAKAEAAEKKALQAERDREAKRAAYEDDALFMYLWRRAYGTPDYRAMPLVRYLDGKVARLVDFARARPNYAMLNRIPERLRAHADKLGAARETARAEVEATARAALERAGIEPLEAAAAAAEAALAEAEDALADARAALAAADARLARHADATRDAAVAAALDGLADAIGRTGLGDLGARAERTADPDDDRAVAALAALARRLVEQEAESERLRGRMRAIGERRARLEESLETFRRGGYDDPRGGFSNGPAIGSVLGGILEGAARSGALEAVLREGFGHRRGRRGRHARAGWPFPAGGGPPPAGARRGPSPIPPRPAGGDGFRTGGTF